MIILAIIMVGITGMTITSATAIYVSILTGQWWDFITNFTMLGGMVIAPIKAIIDAI